jgi:hypothetical protein
MEIVGLFLQQRESKSSTIRSKQDLVYDLTEPWICKSPKPDTIPPGRVVVNNTLRSELLLLCNLYLRDQPHLLQC